MTCDQFSPPEVRLDHAVQALVKRSRGEIACPVVVLSVCVGEEISTENWEVCRSGSLGHAVRLVYSIEVVRERAELSLREQPDRRDKTRALLTHSSKKEKRKENFSVLCARFSSHDIF